MDQYQHRGSYKQFFQGDPRGRGVQPPPQIPPGVPPPPLPPSTLPPWLNQPNPTVPPPPMPPSFLSHQFPPNFPPRHDFTFLSPQILPSYPSSAFPNPGQQHFSPIPQGMRLEPNSTNKPSGGQIEFADWLKRRNIGISAHKVSTNNDVKMRDVREKVNVVLVALRELDNDLKTLGVMVKTVTAGEWESKCVEVEDKKRMLTKTLSELKMNDSVLKKFKEKCSKRSKKRDWLKRRKEKCKRRKEEEEVRIQNRHVQLDNWLKEMQEGVERAQREEELQKEADAVLWGITQKKSECRRQVSLLSAVLELRQVRVKRLTAAGHSVSQSQILTFNTVIERLQKMWERHMEECLVEEQVLRGMLTQQEVRQDPVKTYKKLVLQEWESVIFGPGGTPQSDLKGDDLVQVRRIWDQFAVPAQTVLSSAVPPGWVLPVPPSDQHWHKLLQYDSPDYQ